MTTITYKAPVMAADTKISDGGDTYSANVKKIRKKNGHLIGACGHLDAVHWFLNNFHPDHLTGKRVFSQHEQNRSNNFGALVVTPEGKLYDVSDKLLFTPISAFGYAAIGSGAPIALGAMYAGADAVLAVRAAMRHDLSTGGRVMKVSLLDKKTR